MSSSKDWARAIVAILPALPGLLCLWPAPVSGIEIAETQLHFEVDASDRGLSANLGGLDGVAGAGQLVLQLAVETSGLPPEDDLLIELRVVCSSEGNEVELLSSLDLFPAGEAGGSRQVLFDLSPLAVLSTPPCALESARLQLLPIGENITLVLDEEASDAKLQIVRF